MKAIELLKDFLNKHKNGGGHRCVNEWLCADDMQVYVRRSVYRLIDNQRLVCLDIGNIEVFEKSQGQFTRFLREAHALNPWNATYVESVLEERLFGFLTREGFTLQPFTYPASFYKLTKGEQDESN